MNVRAGLSFEQRADRDAYVGLPEALLAAGVLRPWQLPGAPGNGTTAVTFHADGTRARRGDPRSLLGECGRLQVRRVAKGCLRVEIWRGAVAPPRVQWPFPVVHGSPPL
ncbi:hypothetical protein [Variovorax sp. JS1663]|uniref:hypothetical protein n=1 Tax=Variovorax sp. JS1663 TaxID=1851577 RepID=UPI000B3489BD|nr:hypothetical protein [Variovorax sp. JS1663]OUM01636.1 hypothetical protein A8M77_15295 [Variovorax sp. JS1663]